MAQAATRPGKGGASDPMMQWARDLFPICRSITGPGVRETLGYLRGLLPDLQVHAVPTGTVAFDWTVPKEWTVRDAYIADEQGRRVVDFRKNNLHLVGYSTPVDAWLERAELEAHLHSLPERPAAIPYVTSYYRENWGFCLSHEERLKLKEGRYRAVVDADLKPGVLNYGELLIPGEAASEVLVSANICHPSLASNELSGPIVATALARWLSALPRRRHTYRILYLPETIGSIVFLSRHAEHLKQALVAGFVLTCVGDGREYSYLPSRQGNTLADRALRHALQHQAGEFRRYSYLDRGSDERQYCSPGIDLPVCVFMRSKFGRYPEYHTSDDNLSLLSQRSLEDSLDVLKHAVRILEANEVYAAIHPCEPQLGRRGLYRISGNDPSDDIVNTMAYADGSLDLIGLAEAIGSSALAVSEVAEELRRAGLLRVVR
jgi:aminopeptidase-like protein